MRKILVSLAVAVVVVATPAVAQSGPKYGKNGGIGASSCTYSSGEPTGGGPACTYSIDGTTGTVTASDIGPSKAAPVNGTVKRTITQHLTDVPVVTDYGAVGDGSTDDGAKIADALAASTTSPMTVFPHTANGYKLDSGGFPLGTYPSPTWAWPSNTSVYPSPGWYSLGNNRFQGSAIGNPENCTGFLFSPYTQTCLAITDYKIIMDPASIWAGPNTTNVGLSIGCLPNHRSPNASNVTSAGLRRNWIACVYTEVDTGQDGQPNAGGSGFGSSISTEFVNETLGVGSNHGINREINVNVYGSPTDGGITRAEFILSSCGPFSSGTYSGTSSCRASVKSGKSPWGVTSELGNAVEIGATPFTSTTTPSAQTNGNGETVYSGSAGNYQIYPRWTNGLDVGGSVYNLTARGVVSGESGQYYRAVDASGATVFKVDKSANLTANGSITALNYGSFSNSIQLNGTAATFRYLHFDTAGSSRWEIGEDAGAESGSNAGSDFYISRRTDAGAANGTPLSITRSNGMVKIESALRLPGYTVASLPTCNATYKGVMAHATDVTAVSYNGAPTGGGSLDTVVFCDGTSWKMH